MSSQRSTREVLLSAIDDLEIISKELLDNIIAQKHQKPFSTEHAQLVELLLQKDNDIKATLKV